MEVWNEERASAVCYRRPERKSCSVVPSRGSSIIPRRRAARPPSAAPGKTCPVPLTAEASQTLIQRKPHGYCPTPNSSGRALGCSTEIAKQYWSQILLSFIFPAPQPLLLSDSSILPSYCPIPNKQLAWNYLSLICLSFSTSAPKPSISGSVS